MSDISEFVLARLAETERDCRADMPAAKEEGWRVYVDCVLVNCATVRWMLPLLESVSELGAGYDDGAEQGKQLLKIIAMPYLTHPDYRQEWTP